MQKLDIIELKEEYLNIKKNDNQVTQNTIPDK